MRYQFCQGATGLSGDQLTVLLSQFGSDDDDALLAVLQRSLASAEPCEAAAALRALMRSVVSYFQQDLQGAAVVRRGVKID